MAILKVANEAGKYHDDLALNNVISYCCNPEKIRSGLVGGLAVNPQYAIYEMERITELCRKGSGLRLRHMILSFDPRELQDAYEAFRIARCAAMYYGTDYQIIYCVHEDKSHIHVHFVMNSVSYKTGLKYPGTHKDYYDFQAHLKAILRGYGIRLKMIK